MRWTVFDQNLDQWNLFLYKYPHLCTYHYYARMSRVSSAGQRIFNGIELVSVADSEWIKDDFKMKYHLILIAFICSSLRISLSNMSLWASWIFCLHKIPLTAEYNSRCFKCTYRLLSLSFKGSWVIDYLQIHLFLRRNFLGLKIHILECFLLFCLFIMFLDYQSILDASLVLWILVFCFHSLLTM